jgi:hypothetical protein
LDENDRRDQKHIPLDTTASTGEWRPGKAS